MLLSMEEIKDGEIRCPHVGKGGVCVGNMCAAWRWHDEPTADDWMKSWIFDGTTIPGTATAQDIAGGKYARRLMDRRGYCGLCNRPEQP